MEAAREYRRALELNPGDALARGQYAGLLAREGQVDASIAEARHAVDRDPLAPINRLALTVVLNVTRRFDQAITEVRAGLDLEPEYQQLHWQLGFALVGLGRHGEAVEAFRQASSVSPRDAYTMAQLGWALGLAGKKQEATTILGDLERRQTQEHVPSEQLALVALGLGDHDRAISWLQAAADERNANILLYINTVFFFDPLRADPRFQALLRRMNFPETAASTS